MEKKNKKASLPWVLLIMLSYKNVSAMLMSLEGGKNSIPVILFIIPLCMHLLVFMALSPSHDIL